MDVQAFRPARDARLERQREAAARMLDARRGLDEIDSLMAAALALSTLCGAVARAKGGGDEAAKKLARHMAEAVVRHAGVEPEARR